MIELLLIKEGKTSNDAQHVLGMMEAITLCFSGKQNLNAQQAFDYLQRRAQ